MGRRITNIAVKGIFMKSKKEKKEESTEEGKEIIKLVSQSNYDKAISVAKKYIEKNPNDSEAFMIRSMLYFAQTKYSLALRDINKAIELIETEGIANDFKYIFSFVLIKSIKKEFEFKHIYIFEYWISIIFLKIFCVTFHFKIK